MTVTPFYAAALALLYIALSIYVIRGRYSFGISLGDGGNKRFARRIRAHGNFAEYAPFALLLMAVAELGGATPVVLHVAGLTLLSGRLLHAYALALTERNVRARVGGMVLTVAAIAIGIGACVRVSLFA